MATIRCEQCDVETEARTKTKRFCSPLCQQRSHAPGPRTKACRRCGVAFTTSGPRECNRQYCSRACAVAQVAKRQTGWAQANAERLATRKREREATVPGLYAAQALVKRSTVLDLLGGRCVVCGADNPVWLHVDYIPGTRGSRFRHPRHLAFVRAHLHDFRILCANHHYELTLTGRIKGTDILQ